MMLQVPKELMRPILQHFRDFEGQHSEECIAEVICNDPTMSEADCEEMFASIRPPLPFCGKVRWAEKADKMEWKPFTKGTA